ncbi:hypothetical protein D3C87_2144120 [compost metagenome]
MEENDRQAVAHFNARQRGAVDIDAEFVHYHAQISVSVASLFQQARSFLDRT